MSSRPRAGEEATGNGTGDDERGSFNILMYPWFAMGHLIPFLATANKFADRGHRVTLIIPPNTLSRLQPLNLHPALIQFFPISFPQVQGLPAHVQTTNDLSGMHQFPFLLRALDLTQPTLDSLLSQLKPDFVFYDDAHWLPALARRRGIKSVCYRIVSPAAVCFLFVDDITSSPPGGGLPSSIKLPGYAARELKSILNLKEDSNSNNLSLPQRWRAAMHDSDAMAFKTCEDLDAVYCGFLENKLNKKILLTGPIVPNPPSTAAAAAALDEKWSVWLAKFNPKSVVYCALGSEAILQRDQFQQLLLGFELSGFPFVIALRPPAGANTVEEAFPDGFRERTGERGIVLLGGWAPQHQILEHPSVGCFVTHCGYGSMWEGMMSKCQLVALPHANDQIVQAMLMSRELKIAVEVEKGDEDGFFTKEGVCRAITAAMEVESGVGEEVRANHAKWRDLLQGEGFQDSCFDAFVGKLSSLY